jgi:hypothetical protein
MSSATLRLVTGATPDEPARRYDVEHIRTFLEHLTWELRVRHFDLTNGGSHDELDETVGRYIDGSDTEQLVPAPQFHRQLTPDEQRRFDTWLARRLQAQIDTLEAMLAGVVGDALTCASMLAAGVAAPILQPVEESFIVALPE